MKDELFNELLKSVHEGGMILRGEKPPSRTFIDAVWDVVQPKNSQLTNKTTEKKGKRKKASDAISA